MLNVNWIKQSFRLFFHELKRGELTIIILATILGVASVFSLSGFSEQIKRALMNESTTFLAADRILQSSRPLSTSSAQTINQAVLTAKASQLNLSQAQQVLMSSMVFAGDNMQLVELVAASSLYPLRGELLIKNKSQSEVGQSSHAPETGSVFIEEKLLSLLSVNVGDKLDIGNKTFVIAGIASQIPDASFSVFTSGAKVIINLDDLEATSLVQPGSRVTYKYLFAGSSDDIANLDQWIEPKVNDTQRWYDIKTKQSPLANALNRAEKYLSLASLLGVILAAVAISVSARRYVEKHKNSVAVYKAIGASSNYIRKLYYLHWSCLSIVSISLGLITGYVLAELGLLAIQDSLPITPNHNAFIVSLGYYPFMMAVLTGSVCVIAFAYQPLKQLISTSALTTLKATSSQKEKVLTAAKFQQVIVPIIALFILLLVFSQSVFLSVSLLLSGIIVSGILLALGRLLMNVSRVAGTASGAAWHLALANLTRRASENSVQLVSFTIAIKLLLLIVVIKGALLSEWQAQLPDKAPNVFLVNIASSQTEEVKRFIDDNAIVASDLFSVVRGRLSAINSDKIKKQVSKEKVQADDNGRQGIGRELNLTWRKTIPAENNISKGQWWNINSNDKAVSVEEKLAERLGIKIGDMLSFQIGSQHIKVPVTSLRKVNWQSMQPNFYMIFSPAVLADFPASYISSLYVPKNQKTVLQSFLSSYPSISIIDVDAMIEQLRRVIAQVSKAIEFILVLVVLAGCLVLVAQVQASMNEREREIAILRTLGAKGSLLRNSILFEFIALGAIAGLMASMAMELSVYLLQTYLFQMQTSFHFDFWIIGIVAGSCFVGFIGLLSCSRLLNLSSMTLIRRTL